MFQRLDYEASDDHEYRFRIKAKNISPDPNYLGIMEDVVEVVVRVTDVNEPPEFSKSDFFLEGKRFVVLKYEFWKFCVVYYLQAVNNAKFCRFYKR